MEFRTALWEHEIILKKYDEGSNRWVDISDCLQDICPELVLENGTMSEDDVDIYITYIQDFLHQMVKEDDAIYQLIFDGDSEVIKKEEE